MSAAKTGEGKPRGPAEHSFRRVAAEEKAGKPQSRTTKEDQQCWH